MDTDAVCIECTPGTSSPFNSHSYDACTCSGAAYRIGEAYSISGQPHVCIHCENGSFWNEPTVVPNTALSVPHDAETITGDWYVSPVCMKSLSNGLILHFPFDDAGLHNTAPFGPAVSLISIGSPLVIQPGRVGVGYAGGLDTGVGYMLPDSVDVASIFGTGRQLTYSAWIKTRDNLWPVLFRSTEMVSISISPASVLSIDICGEYFAVTSPIVIGRWTHVTVAVSTTTNSAHVLAYTDSVLTLDRTLSRTACRLEFTDVFIGTSIGSIDDVRLYNRILSAEEVAALCPRDMRGLIFHAPYDMDARDYSGYAAVATVATNGPATVQYPVWSSSVGSAALYTASVTDSAGVQYDTLPDVDVTNNGFSFSFFIQIDYDDMTHSNLLLSFQSTTDSNMKFMVYHHGTVIGTMWSCSGGPNAYVWVSVGYTSGTNVHIAISIENKRIQTWVDGILAQDAQTSLNPFGVTSFTMGVLSLPDTLSGVVQAYIDDLHVYSHSLIQSDVDVLYAKKNTMGGCYDRTLCASVPSDTIPLDCWAGASGPPGPYRGLVLHFPLDDELFQNMAPFGPSVTLVPISSAVITGPGAVGIGYAAGLTSGNAFSLDGFLGFFGDVPLFTFSAWVLPDRAGLNKVIAEFTDSSDNRIFSVRINTGSLPYVHFCDGGYLSNTPIADGVWIHITVTLNGLQDISHMYINGVFVKTGTNTVLCGTPFTGIEKMVIGDPGGIDDVRLYNRILSTDEVATLYKSGLHPSAQSSFPFYCTEATDVSFSSYVEHVDTYPHPIRVKTESDSAWVRSVAVPQANSMGEWSTTLPTVFAMGAGPHTVTVGASVGSVRVSHIRFALGSDSCYFYTNGDTSSPVCTQCPFEHETFLTELGTSSCRTCAKGFVFNNVTRLCGCPMGYTPVETRVCTACNAGTYKSLTGMGACSSCPEGLNSPSASTSLSDCVCNDRYFKPAN
jgi:hypothetical protein